MQEPVLLGEFGPERELDHDLPRGDAHQRGAEGGHHGLPVEARPDALFELRIARCLGQAYVEVFAGGAIRARASARPAASNPKGPGRLLYAIVPSVSMTYNRVGQAV